MRPPRRRSASWSTPISARPPSASYIYGQFGEDLGRNIYDGFWTRAGTGQWHLRDDVIEALRRIQVPVLRWPGGCFADYYHWRDGVGPRDRRPRMVNTVWGGVTEDNSFGTHEFLELIQRLGAEPFIVGNVGSGTVDEMSKWWEYLHAPTGSPLGDERAANGHPEPFSVRFWGVGNESWGCGGAMTPQAYADAYKRYAEYVRGSRPFRIASGPNTDDYAWTETMMREAGRMIDGLDFHYYTVVGPWSHKGSATDFGEREWFTALQRAERMDTLITRHSTIMDQYDPAKRVWLIVGEWGMWHDPEPGSTPGFLYQQNTLRDAVVAGLHLNIFNSHADRVRMANIAQTVNVLQSVILTRGEQMVLTPTYWVFDLYKVHQDATLLPLHIASDAYTFNGQSVPAVSASASKDKDGRIHITSREPGPQPGPHGAGGRPRATGLRRARARAHGGGDERRQHVRAAEHGPAGGLPRGPAGRRRADARPALQVGRRRRAALSCSSPAERNRTQRPSARRVRCAQCEGPGRDPRSSRW